MTPLEVPEPGAHEAVPPAHARAAPTDALTPFEDALRRRLPSREALIAEARAQTGRQRARRAAAAALGVFALAAVLLAADPAWHVETLGSARGGPAPHTLADGSVVVLDTATTLRVAHHVRTRRLVLEAGAATFDVAHGWRAFTVRAGDVLVRDIGTAFAVQRHGNGADVGVLGGEVEVSAPGEAPRRLLTGQAWRVGGAVRDAPVRVVAPEDLAPWRHGRLVFDGTPLAEVVTQVARYHPARVVLDDAAAGALRLSGVYDLQGLDALLDALPHALPVAVRRDDDGTVHVASARPPGKK